MNQDHELSHFKRRRKWQTSACFYFRGWKVGQVPRPFTIQVDNMNA